MKLKSKKVSERYKVVRKERERGRKSKQMKMTGNAEHVTQASLKMRKMEINASGYSAYDKCKLRGITCILFTFDINEYLCPIPAGIWKMIE